MTEMIKGKRTKRQRPVSPLSLAITSSSSNLGDQESGDERERISNNMVSASSSSEFAECVREEEDMANCLILLANGHQTLKSLEPSVTTSNPKVSSLSAYECKTCNRRFPSFQALGGHRASHKKPNKPNEEKKPVVSVLEQEEDQFNAMSTILSLHMPNRVVCNNGITNTIKASKVHECSICGAEFSSGQALGGHMRRHRAFASTSTTPSTTTTTTTTTMSLVTRSPESQESKRPRNSLELDLNLPAPEDDLQDNEFHFSSKEQVLVFSMSSLVDCHY